MLQDTALDLRLYPLALSQMETDMKNISKIKGYTVTQQYVETYGFWMVEVRDSKGDVLSTDYLPNETEVMSLMDYIKEEYSEC
jgi:hypothetical protein